MPTVDGKHFPYTKKGKTAAKKEKRKMSTSDGYTFKKK